MALPRRTVYVLLFACCLVASPGCGGTEPITTYTVPRSAEAKRPTYRILGAVYPQDKPVWYFKFTGTEDDIAKHEADFGRLMASVRAPVGDKMPEFTLPLKWVNIGERVTERMGISNKTDAVLKIGSKDSTLEVTVNRNDGGLGPNLIRWADQVDADYDPATIAESGSPFPANGMNGLRVDFRGPKNPSAPSGPMMKR